MSVPSVGSGIGDSVLVSGSSSGGSSSVRVDVTSVCCMAFRNVRVCCRTVPGSGCTVHKHSGPACT